jgi:hypothetical protein
MMRHFAQPSEELSRRLLGTVPYKDRLPAGRLMPPVGIIPGHVRSLRELHLLLTPDARSLPGLSLTALANWVQRAIGDLDLAHALRNATENAGSYVEGCLTVYELVGLRLEQAREVVGQEFLT